MPQPARFIKHREVDKSKWDSLVALAKPSHIYMLSWYLDAACESWDAIVWGDYEAAIPLPTKRWWILKKVYQPFFVQQTGLCWKHGFVYLPALKELLGGSLLNAYYAVRIHFHAQVRIGKNSFGNYGWNLENRKNYVLPLSPVYENIYGGYNENRRRNLKKAYAIGWQVVSSLDIDAAIVMYQHNQATKQHGLKMQVYPILKRIFQECTKREMGELLVCVDKDGNALAYAFFAKSAERIYYLFGTMNPIGRERSAISLFFDYIIKKYSGCETKLDFEGGNIDNIGSYFASLGAVREDYTCLWRNIAARW